VSRGEVQVDEAAKIARQELTLNMEQAGKTFALRVNLILPHKPAGPVPVIIQSSFGRLPPVNAQNQQNQPNAANPRPNRYAVFTGRGYGYAEFSFNDVAPDNKDRFRSGGVYQLFGNDIDTGALMAWAWGVHRVIDALESDDRIDAKKVVVTGHSRYGKASLIAGAFDDRIAVTVPSHSGTAGASPYRFIYGKNEQLHNIVGAFPYWFRPDFNQFVNDVPRLPFDQHELIALVAPRAVLATEGTQDIWINPQGSQLTHLAAKQVYEFLGAPDRISIRFRPVGHIPSNDDLLDFSDHVFFGKALPEEFGKPAYPADASGFTWSAPK
jgi:endo-1,4-beta-xylanase